MFKIILLLCGVFFMLQDTGAVETGLYHCFPAHAAHLLQQDDGEFSEITLSTEGAVAIIQIGADRIEITDTRSAQKKVIAVISNESDGSIQGQSGLRRFYMNGNLHYFYGSTDQNNTVAYAEEGMCHRFGN